MSMDAHQQAIKQLESVAQFLRTEYEGADQQRFDAAIERLKTPDRVLETELSIKLDNGKTKKFTAYRAQHNNARGPYKGGIRFHPQVTKAEVMALSTWMSWKCAVTGIPYGGGKGGVVVDPKQLSAGELQRLSRAYAKFLTPYIGPWTDVPAPDVNTTPQIMAWMVDEYQNQLRDKATLIDVSGGGMFGVAENPLATFTGKPVALGGSEGREEATGYGGVVVLEELVAKLLADQPKKEITVAIQGFGNVGYWFAYHAHQLGYTVVAVSDSRGAIYTPQGLDPQFVAHYKRQHGQLPSDGYQQLTNAELLELKVDILVPAALESVITPENAHRIAARAIIEMANGPTTPEADEILHRRGILVLPDVLANAGGVSTSYFEWVQNLQGYSWSHEEVISRLKKLMITAFDQTWEMYQKTRQTGRQAAYMNAVQRIVDAMIMRGQV